MIFYLGAPEPSWLEHANVPLFVSRVRLNALGRKAWPKARAPWALDSGGFKELERHGRWTVEPKDYVREVRLAAEKIGKLSWAASMDWMTEPPILYGGPTDPGSVAVGTGLSVEEHQFRTIESYCKLRELGGRDMAHLWAPVLQGWCVEDYLEHVNLWWTWGRVDLTQAPVVGVGSVCRRQGTEMASALFRILTEQFGLKGHLHAFGSKTLGLQLEARVGKVAEPDLYATWGVDARAAGWPEVAIERAMRYATSAGPSTWEESDVEVCRLLQSSDSMAWSAEARHYANDVREARDKEWGDSEQGAWGQRGGSIYVDGRIVLSAGGKRVGYEGGREVGRVRPELAGQPGSSKHPLAPTQMLAACAEAFARGDRGGMHLSCANCSRFALAWRAALLSKLPPDCRSIQPPKFTGNVDYAPCAAGSRVALRRAEAARYLTDLQAGGRPDPERWAKIQAMPGAEGPLLPLQGGFERMTKPRPRPMPEVALCRAWGTGGQRWGEARIVQAGAPEIEPMPSPWQPWRPEDTRRLLEEHMKKPRSKRVAVDLSPVDTGLRDALLAPRIDAVDPGLRDALLGEGGEA